MSKLKEKNGTTYQSEIAAAVHESAEDMHCAGVISDKRMREYDAMCLTEVHEFGAEEIRQLRLGEKVSQSTLAHYLNISKDLVSQWERGEKKPESTALKLLSLIKRKGIDAIA